MRPTRERIDALTSEDMVLLRSHFDDHDESRHWCRLCDPQHGVYMQRMLATIEDKQTEADTLRTALEQVLGVTTAHIELQKAIKAQDADAANMYMSIIKGADAILIEALGGDPMRPEALKELERHDRIGSFRAPTNECECGQPWPCARKSRDAELLAYIQDLERALTETLCPWHSPTWPVKVGEACGPIMSDRSPYAPGAWGERQCQRALAALGSSGGTEVPHA